MLGKLGSLIIQIFADIPYMSGYVGKVLASSFVFLRQDRAAAKILIMQLLFTFIEALPLICVLSLAMGSAIYLIGYSFLLSLGQTDLIYMVQVLVVTQELGPLLVAFVITARSATAIATELAGMVTTHQIESYVSIGIDPINHLAVPRFLGVTLSVFLLNLYFSLCGLLGPALVGRFVDPVAASEYFPGLFKALSVSTIGISVLKSVIFGMIVSIVATYYGFNVERSSTEIPVAGINAVGKSFFGIILADVFIIVLGTVF